MMPHMSHAQKNRWDLRPTHERFLLGQDRRNSLRPAAEGFLCALLSPSPKARAPEPDGLKNRQMFNQYCQYTK
jgi:hypothetical protein